MTTRMNNAPGIAATAGRHAGADLRFDIEGKVVAVLLTRAAERALARRTTPLLVEMELYFSCLIRKRVNFVDDGSTLPAADVTNRLAVRFRPVMTAHCGLDYDGEEPPLEDFPLIKVRPYVPRWLHIDYVGGQWRGEFGY